MEDRLTRQEAAEILNISVPRLAQLRRAGHIECEKNPHTNQVRYVYRDVIDLARRRTQCGRVGCRTAPRKETA
jgi:predicted site-specific integrase-resolvase